MSVSTTRFAADYAKRVAGCKKCKLQLPKGEIRLAKITPNPFVQNAEGPPPDMKMYFHPNCLFEMFFKARATTKVIEGTDDIEGWDDLKDEDKESITKLIDELTEHRAAVKEGTTKPTKKPKTPTKGGATTPEKVRDNVLTTNRKSQPNEMPKNLNAIKIFRLQAPQKSAAALIRVPPSSRNKRNLRMKRNQKEKRKMALMEVVRKEVENRAENQMRSPNTIPLFCKLCEVVASVSKYTDKSSAVNMYISRDDFDGDVLTLIRLLLPGVDQRVYNVKEKQIIKHFATKESYDPRIARLTASVLLLATIGLMQMTGQ
ncbi:unnamed protein product [Nippostrongylus brasiliensis]|uniref:DNA ligase 3 (inferred by orthology to a human protein) n=1 Tax=Nippostrongylus brasiliensis TaxID=27835 RepID=A0A0N4YH11_NIPBR|nr:unnamed protein product [Nippostrongylus brasiliensis]